MNIDTTNKLFDDGVLTDLYKAGLISTKIFIYRDIYLWIQAHIKTRGISKNQAVLDAETKFGKDERTIWRALNSFSTDTLVSPKP